MTKYAFIRIGLIGLLFILGILALRILFPNSPQSPKPVNVIRQNLVNRGDSRG